MNPKSLIALLGLALPTLSMAQSNAKTQIEGYYYGNMPAPTHWEWQSPDSIAYNKQAPKAWFFSFADTKNALRVLPENSEYYRSLNGDWKFHWVAEPSQRPVDFYQPSFDVSRWDNIKVPYSWNMAGMNKGEWKYGRPIYSNQRVIFQHQIAVNDWKGGVMRTPPKDWLTYKYRNEVGSYRRTFTIPNEWKGREVYINFDAIDSFFYLWINGHYVGFSKNSRNLAAFNITPYLQKGENVVAVEVYRHSDGSFLESQDMFRLPGINRDVYLTAKPKVQVRDVVAIPTFTDNHYSNAALDISTYVANLSNKKTKDLTLDYSLYAVKLYGDETTAMPVKGKINVSGLGKNAEEIIKLRLNAGNQVMPWSAERPQRYVLVGQLKDNKGKLIETFSTYVGFRQIEIKDTPASQDEFGKAGRYYYLNGQPIKFKGVNRHETNPLTGHAIAREQMEHEVMLMKQNNINHVRDCHYPEPPYWYVLCNKYGIYLEDEANIESHEYYYGKESLSRVKEFRNAHVARNLEMVHANVNNPCIVLWSLGNEAGPGKNFEFCYEAIKNFDTSRPVQYERNNDIVDIGSNQYPSVDWVRAAATGDLKIKYPFHISEYAHSMGNAVGDLIDYWEAIESSNFVMGGAIWDWVDQAMYNYDTKTGDRYWAYGGDFGDKPNDGMFSMNGLLRPDFTPKAQLYEVKKVYQNVGVKMVDANNGNIEIFNKNYFEPLKGYQILGSLWKDGQQVGQERYLEGPKMLVSPREKMIFRFPMSAEETAAPGEYFVKVQFKQAADTPWAKAGYVQMEAQLPLKNTAALADISSVQPKGLKPAIGFTKDNKATISGKDFKVVFDLRRATIDRLQYGDKTMIESGNGPTVDAFRAPVDNDVWVEQGWFKNGLNIMQQKAQQAKVQEQPDGSVILTFLVENQAPYGGYDMYSDRDRNPQDVHKAHWNTDKPFGPNDFKFITNMVYTVYPDGSVSLKSSITSNRPQLELARIGYALRMPSQFNQWTYYGRGPVNNYRDRKTSQFIEEHATPLDQSYIVLPKPQAMGNREDVRWMSMTDADGDGLLFRADSTFSCSALPWSQDQIMGAAHIYQLPKSDGTYLHIDAKVRGLGGASCGPGPMPEDLVKAVSYPHVNFLIRPIKGNNQKVQAAVNNDALAPIALERNGAGKVTIFNPRKGIDVYYRINNGKPQRYTEPFIMMEGGTIKAYYQDRPRIVFSDKYEKIDRIPVRVIYVSSYEPNGGEAENLIDGDLGTIWHTQYGVTLTKYPHWVDFDVIQPKTVTGFVYSPRRDGPNGRVKDYEIFVSNDNKNWTLANKGAFPNSDQPQRVMLQNPTKARYVRFKALSEQNGNDFASGAEFQILTKEK